MANTMICVYFSTKKTFQLAELYTAREAWKGRACHEVALFDINTFVSHIAVVTPKDSKGWPVVARGARP